MNPSGPAAPGRGPAALVVFDLDGTLLRGPTVCELLAGPLDRLDRMQELERYSAEADVAAAREEMVTWYRAFPLADLTACLETVPFAPGAEAAIALLRGWGVTPGIASLTWEFAVERLARRLGVEHFVGTRLGPTGSVEHVWARDKAVWAAALCRRLSIPAQRLVAVGDSAGDLDLLRVASHRVFVGDHLPAGLPPVHHVPRADLHAVAQWILERLGWKA